MQASDDKKEMQTGTSFNFHVPELQNKRETIHLPNRPRPLISIPSYVNQLQHNLNNQPTKITAKNPKQQSINISLQQKQAVHELSAQKTQQQYHYCKRQSNYESSTAKEKNSGSFIHQPPKSVLKQISVSSNLSSELQSIESTASMENLSTQINNLQLRLEHLNGLTEADDDETIKQWAEQKVKIEQSLIMELANEKDSIKSALKQKVEYLDRQFAHMVKDRIKNKKKGSKCIRDEIEQLKIEKQVVLKKLKRIKEDKFGKLRQMNKQLRKSIKQVQSTNQERRKVTMGRSQTIRANLHKKIDEQQQKREQKNKVIMKLLEGICQNAQKSIRRTVQC